MPSLYLAGPITGLTYFEAVEWREYVKANLEPDIQCFSPLRYQASFRHLGRLDSWSRLPDDATTTPKAIMTRDHLDCMTRDLIFCNLLGTKQKSTGTIMEAAWAFAYRKPLVLVIEKDFDNPHSHPMMMEAADFITHTLDEAIDVTRCILLA